MSFHAWKLLSSNLIRERVAHNTTLQPGESAEEDKPVTMPMAMLRYCEEIINPPCDLRIYTAPLIDLDQALVYLCIDNVSHFGTNQLLHLSELPNLAALEIIDREVTNQTNFDRLTRAWMTRPDPERQFNKLRLLKITLEGQATMTEDSLGYLFGMRYLEILDVTARPAARWRGARDMAEARREGWRVAELESWSSPFVSYAAACLDGRTEVDKKGVAGLREAFEDDRQQVAFTDTPKPLTRRPFDDGWAAVLQGEHALSATDTTRSLSGNDVFWLLALLTQIDTQNGTRNGPDYESPKHPIYAQMAGISVPEQQFVNLQLREPPTMGGHGDLNSDRLLFYRVRGKSNNPEAEEAPRPRTPPPPKPEPEPSWAPRPDDRRETGLKPRKRQKLGDIFSGFG